MPLDTSTDWTLLWNGQPVSYSGTVSLEDCEEWTTTTPCGDFSGELTVELKASPNVYAWMKAIFCRIPAKMLSSHIWSKHCQKLRRALRARWRA